MWSYYVFVKWCNIREMCFRLQKIKVWETGNNFEQGVRFCSHPMGIQEIRLEKKCQLFGQLIIRSLLNFVHYRKEKNQILVCFIISAPVLLLFSFYIPVHLNLKFQFIYVIYLYTVTDVYDIYGKPEIL